MKLTKGSKLAKAILLGLILVVAMPVAYFRARAWTWPRAGQEDREVREWSRCPRWPLGRTWPEPKQQHLIGRHRRVDRDGDGDFDRNDVLLGAPNRVDRDGDGDFDRNDVLLGRRNRVDRDGDGDFDSRDVRLSRRARRNTRWNR